LFNSFGIIVVAETENQTEAATPTRLTKAVSEGDVVVSRELTVFAALGAGVVALGIFLPDLLKHLEARLAGLISASGTTDSPSAIFGRIIPPIETSLQVIVVMGLVIGAGAIGATLLQTGLKFKKNAIGIHFDRINPMRGVANLFSLRHTIDSVQSILKIIFIGVIIYFVVCQKIVTFGTQIILPVANLPFATGNAIFSILLAGVGIQGVVAVVDLAWSKRQFATRNQMSQNEVKDEQREIDGDPAVKAKLRMLRAQQAKRNLKVAMARATVVVTNPTHYAVALEYQAGQTSAPRVVAKGADHLAAKIREMAAELRLPVVANPPLARALYVLEEDAEITPEHYRAVAEVIAYIWKLADRNGGSAGNDQPRI
jgi:flagellar biosynthetic protein FlhB